MSRSRSYVMTGAILERLERKGYSLVCERCRKPILTGERVVSRRSSGKHSHKVKRYH